VSSLWEKQYEAVGNLFFTWQMTAKSLLHASQMLRDRAAKAGATPQPPPTEDNFLTPIELMLRGMAVENLLKAIWVHKGNKLVKGGKFAPIPAPNHDLVKIAATVGIVLNVQEEDLLMRLSHFIEYPGRYPMPMNQSKLELQPSPSGGKSQATHWTAGPDDKLFDGFIARLTSKLP
jgi:hypothetical protein